jgi:hypothetical protein
MRQFPEVVPKSLLVKIPEKMEWLDAYVCSLESALEQTPKVFQSVCVNLAVNVSFRVVDHVVAVIANESVIRLQLVAEKGRASGNVILHFFMDCFLAAIRKNLCTDFATAFQDSHDNCFVVRATYNDSSMVNVGMHVTRFSADESFVNFDFAAASAEFQKRLSLHRQANPVKHEPRGLLGDAERTPNFVGTDSVLAVRNQPYCDEPFVETERRILKDSPDLCAELPMAVDTLALPLALIRKERHILPSASGADNAVRPAQAHHELEAVIWVCEVDDGLLECLWLIHVSHLSQMYSLRSDLSSILLPEMASESCFQGLTGISNRGTVD